MFGPTVTLIALVVLIMLCAGALAYALLFRQLDRNAGRDQRLGQIKSRNIAAAAAQKARNSDAARRRKSIQDSLTELEERQKAKAKSARPPLMTRLQQAGLSWTKRTYIFISIGIGFFILVATVIAGFPLYASGILAVVGVLAVPRWLVNFLRKRRFKKFLREFPNAVDVVVRGIKAGLPLNDCLRMIANEASEPVRSEFKIVNESQSMGLGVPEAVGRLPERIPVPETNFFAIVIAIQAKAGGNLSEALGNLSRVLRERKKMKDKIGAMSMEAKASAVIIGALPIIVMGMVYLSSPRYIALLFTETLGNIILAASAAWMFIGIMVMRKMINFDY